MSDTLGPLMERNLLEVFGQRGDGITVLLLQRGSLEVCRVADASHGDASTRANSWRRQLAKGRNRGRWSAEGAAGAMGMLPISMFIGALLGFATAKMTDALGTPSTRPGLAP